MSEQSPNISSHLTRGLLWLTRGAVLPMALIGAGHAEARDRPSAPPALVARMHNSRFPEEVREDAAVLTSQVRHDKRVPFDASVELFWSTRGHHNYNRITYIPLKDDGWFFYVRFPHGLQRYAKVLPIPENHGVLPDNLAIIDNGQSYRAPLTHEGVIHPYQGPDRASRDYGFVSHINYEFDHARQVVKDPFVGKTVSTG